MFDRVSLPTTLGLTAGYLLASVAARVLRVFDQADSPHFALFGSITASVAVLALTTAIGLLRHRHWAIVLAQVYFWFILVVSIVVATLAMFGVVHPGDYGASVPGFVVSIVFALFFITMLRGSCLALSNHEDGKT